MTVIIVMRSNLFNFPIIRHKQCIVLAELVKS